MHHLNELTCTFLSETVLSYYSSMLTTHQSRTI